MPESDPADNQPAGYDPPMVWTWEKPSGGAFENVNRPVSGATHEKALPVGKHPLQLYSMGTPNGVKVTIMLEELLAAGHEGAEYDAWFIDIGEGDQFGSGFVSINPNSKIPAIRDHSLDPPVDLFESGSILFYLAEKFGEFLPTDTHVRAQTMNWLMWQMGSAPYVGGGFGHFYHYAPFRIEYAIDRFTMETKRQMHVLDTHLAMNEYMVGDTYTIADMAIYPWYGNMMRTAYNSQEFLSVHEYNEPRPIRVDDSRTRGGKTRHHGQPHLRRGGHPAARTPRRQRFREQPRGYGRGAGREADSGPRRMNLDRRQAVIGVAAATLATLAGISPTLAGDVAKPADMTKPFIPMEGQRSRLLFVNDLSGDLDGLYAAVHAILSPSTQLRGIVGTGTTWPGETAERSTALAMEILDLMDMAGSVKVHAGAVGKLTARGVPVKSPGTQAIIDEAMRSDTQLPLYVAVGGGLTEMASALMIEPEIADKLTLVWIGGAAYPDGESGETNFEIDPLAAQYVFNDTIVPIWQVPQNTYATCLVSASELQAFVAPNGAIGEWLYRQVVNAPAKYRGMLNMGETWTLGDNPLVLLTALTGWAPSRQPRPFKYDRTGSSHYDEVFAPHLNADGTYTARQDGRKIRVYNSVDNRMMLNDLFAKLRIHFGR